MRSKNFVDYTLGKNNIEQEENKEPKRRPNVKRGLVTLFAVGVGTYVLGNITGAKYGYRRGFDNGIIHTVNHFADCIKVLADKYKEESKGD